MRVYAKRATTTIAVYWNVSRFKKDLVKLDRSAGDSGGVLTLKFFFLFVNLHKFVTLFSPLDDDDDDDRKATEYSRYPTPEDYYLFQGK